MAFPSEKALAKIRKESEKWEGSLALSPKATAAERFRYQTNSEHRLLGVVQQRHLPFAVLLQAAGNAAKQIAANRPNSDHG